MSVVKDSCLADSDRKRETRGMCVRRWQKLEDELFSAVCRTSERARIQD